MWIILGIQLGLLSDSLCHRLGLLVLLPALGQLLHRLLQLSLDHGQLLNTLMTGETKRNCFIFMHLIIPTMQQLRNMQISFRQIYATYEVSNDIMAHVAYRSFDGNSQKGEAKQEQHCRLQRVERGQQRPECSTEASDVKIRRKTEPADTQCYLQS